jgi:hypothetical protein
VKKIALQAPRFLRDLCGQKIKKHAKTHLHTFSDIDRRATQCTNAYRPQLSLQRPGYFGSQEPEFQDGEHEFFP